MSSPFTLGEKLANQARWQASARYWRRRQQELVAEAERLSDPAIRREVVAQAQIAGRLALSYEEDLR